MIDDALARMTGSTTITSHPAFQTDDQPGPSTPRLSTPLAPPARPVPSRSGSSRRAVIRVSDAELDVTRYCGEMASLGVMLERFACELTGHATLLVQAHPQPHRRTISRSPLLNPLWAAHHWTGSPMLYAVWPILPVPNWRSIRLSGCSSRHEGGVGSY